MLVYVMVCFSYSGGACPEYLCNSPGNNGEGAQCCTWVKKLIERAAIRLLLGSEQRGLQFINSVKNFLFIFIYIYIIKKVNSEARKMGEK